MDCPRCRTAPLTERPAMGTGLRVDRCTKCEGVWFDAGELNQVSDVTLNSFEPPRDADPTDFLCPRCEEILYTFKYPQTNAGVDVCRKCRGIWLDKGEMEQIIETRSKLAEEGKLDPYGRPGTTKAKLLQFIDKAINSQTQ